MKKELDIFDKPENVKKVKLIFGACLIVLVLFGFFIDWHPHFSWEEIPAFYALYGFIACVSLVFIAKGLRKIVMREEDYYDR